MQTCKAGHAPLASLPEPPLPCIPRRCDPGHLRDAARGSPAAALGAGAAAAQGAAPQSAALLGRRHVCGVGRQELVALGGIPARCHARCRFVPAVFVLGDARMRGCDARLAVLRAQPSVRPLSRESRSSRVWYWRPGRAQCRLYGSCSTLCDGHANVTDQLCPPPATKTLKRVPDLPRRQNCAR